MVLYSKYEIKIKLLLSIIACKFEFEPENEILVIVAYAHWIGGNRKRSKQSTNVDKTIDRNSVSDCHLSPVWRQMAIENSVSKYF